MGTSGSNAMVHIEVNIFNKYKHGIIRKTRCETLHFEDGACMTVYFVN